jgi:hypothetical protein
MAMSVDTSAIRTVIHNDVQAAWGPTLMFDDAPYLEPTRADLPRAFVIYDRLQITRGGMPGASGLKDNTITVPWMITGEFTWPDTSTTTFTDLKEQKANLLLARLTANPARYAGWFYNVNGDMDFHVGETTDGEAFYSITIPLQVFVVTDA